MVDIQPATADIGRGKKKKEEETNHRTKIYATQSGHNKGISEGLMYVAA